MVKAGRIEGTANTEALEKLLSKIKIALDSAERRRLDNDLDLLTRLQRSRVAAGPAVIASPEDLTTIQSAILAAHCGLLQPPSSGSGLGPAPCREALFFHRARAL